MKKILFISHDATPSGAPIVLLGLIEWLKANTDIEITVLLKDGGPLAKKFSELAPVYFFNLTYAMPGNRLASFFYRRVVYPFLERRHKATLFEQLKQKNFDLIYSNTIANGSVLEFLAGLKCKVLSHIHELQFVIDCLGEENARQVVAHTQTYIAVSAQVKQHLCKRFNLPEEKIVQIPPFIDFSRVEKLKSEIDSGALKRELGIPENAFVIGCAGSLEWRKGGDIFVSTAINAVKKLPNAYFIWVGGERDKNLLSRLRFDIEKAGLPNRILFTGYKPNPYPYFAMWDLFLLTSREDPYPLVCLENMYLQKPVVCFAGSGGGEPLVGNYQCGVAVPYMDIEEATKAISVYCLNVKGATIVDINRLKTEHDINMAGVQILQAINKL
ncbi:MAG TPA: glycosyltransferase [Chitinophagales bacterium]|nr:glycosyltransferase [Chitinophagales bacterium]